jgi:hypothetical protein
LQFYLEDMTQVGTTEDDLDRFGRNLARYAHKPREMFYDFTIRSSDGGSIPANKERN